MHDAKPAPSSEERRPDDPGEKTNSGSAASNDGQGLPGRTRCREDEGDEPSASRRKLMQERVKRALDDPGQVPQAKRLSINEVLVSPHEDDDDIEKYYGIPPPLMMI